MNANIDVEPNTRNMFYTTWHILKVKPVEKSMWKQLSEQPAGLSATFFRAAPFDISPPFFVLGFKTKIIDNEEEEEKYKK